MSYIGSNDIQVLRTTYFEVQSYGSYTAVVPVVRFCRSFVCLLSSYGLLLYWYLPPPCISAATLLCGIVSNIERKTRRKLRAPTHIVNCLRVPRAELTKTNCSHDVFDRTANYGRKINGRNTPYPRGSAALARAMILRVPRAPFNFRDRLAGARNLIPATG